ncbi:nitroreductase family protein [Paracoccus sp. SJTW-4]|uniref:nitroreductase family protein n=1 Tax=Paracoccus sp. SJTW-4 TaxID=3078428 RepID=UPI0039E8126B
MMSIDEAVAGRRSVRGYLPDEVPQDRLRELLALAQMAPSNCNIQPWITHVLSGPSLRSLGDKMVAAAEAGIPPDPDFSADRKFEGVYRARQIDAAVQLYGAMGSTGTTARAGTGPIAATSISSARPMQR